MLLTVNPDLSLLVEQPLSRQPLAVVKLPRGSKVPIWVQFARDGAVIDPSEALTSGTLVVGLYYKITTFVTGDSFTNVGAASNATSVYFLCTGTTPTTWTNSSTLQQCDSAGVLFSLIFSVKKHQEYDGAVLVLASGTDFTKFGTGTSTIFKSKCSFSTAEINTLLGVDASVANDGSEVTLMGEVSWLGPDESKAFPFQIDLQNDSYKTNDVVTSTPGVQAMSLVTTGTEALLPGSKVLTAGSNITITVASGTVTIASSASGGTWGSITGTLSAQTDLQSALNAKQDALTLGTGVATALAVSVGGAGAFITLGGDAGTPSELVGTNITGTASGLTAGNATLAADVDPAGTDIAAALAGKLPLAGGTMESGAVVNLFNGSKWQQSTPNKGIAGTAGFSIICSVGYEYKFANGYLFVLSDNSTTVRKVLYAPATPTVTDDTTLGYTTDTTWEMADGTLYECTDVAEGAAVWAVVPAFAAPGVIGGTTPDVVNTTELNVKDSGGTTTASINGVAGTASFGYQGGNIGLHIDQFGNITTNNNAEANLFAFYASEYVTAAAGAIKLGTNTGTAAWIHSDGSAMFGGGGCTIDQWGSLVTPSVESEYGITVGLAAGGGTPTAQIWNDGSASFASGGFTISSGGVLGYFSADAAYFNGDVRINPGRLNFGSSPDTAYIDGADGSASFSSVTIESLNVTNAGGGTTYIYPGAMALWSPSTGNKYLRLDPDDHSVKLYDSGIYGDTPTLTLNSGVGSASFASGYLTIDAYGNISAPSSSLYIDTVLADNGFWAWDGATIKAKVDYDGTAEFATGAITLGKNTGTAAYIDEYGNLWASGSGTFANGVVEIDGANGDVSLANGGLTIVNGVIVSNQPASFKEITVGGTAVGPYDGSLTIKNSGDTTTTYIDSAGTLTLAGAFIGGTQALTTAGGAGAVNLTTLTSEVETTGTLDALTLANGTVGQIKVITHTVGAFTSVLTPTTALGFTSITFLASLGQTCTLEYTTAGWVILAVGGLTLPVVA